MAQLKLSRQQLSAFLKDHESIKQFEKLFAVAQTVDPETGDNELAISAANAESRAQQAVDLVIALAEEVANSTAFSDAKANQAIDAISRIANSLELIALAPVPQAVPFGVTSNNFDHFQFRISTGVPQTPPSGFMSLYAQDAAGVARLRALHSTGSDLAFFRDSVVRVKNTSGGTINKGEIVYCTGATGNFPTIAKARANAAGTMPAIGMVLATAANNAFTTVQTAGEMTGLNTSAFAEGTSLFVSSATAGAMTATEPQHPFLSQEIGFCTKSNAGAGSVQLFCTPAHEGDDFGSNRNTYYIGDAAAGTKTLGFQAAFLGGLAWAPTAARTVTIPDESGGLLTNISDGKNQKHKRVTTGSVSAGSTALVTVTWATAFADANYTVTAQVEDSTTTSLSLSVVHIESRTASAVTVRVLNNALGALTGTLHVVAIHD